MNYLDFKIAMQFLYFAAIQEEKKNTSEWFILIQQGKEREWLFSKHCKALDQKHLSVLHLEKKKGKGRKEEQKGNLSGAPL